MSSGKHAKQRQSFNNNSSSRSSSARLQLLLRIGRFYTAACLSAPCFVLLLFRRSHERQLELAHREWTEAECPEPTERQLQVVQFLCRVYGQEKQQKKQQQQQELQLEIGDYFASNAVYEDNTKMLYSSSMISQHLMRIVQLQGFKLLEARNPVAFAPTKHRVRIVFDGAMADSLPSQFASQFEGATISADLDPSTGKILKLTASPCGIPCISWDNYPILYYGLLVPVVRTVISTAFLLIPACFS